MDDFDNIDFGNDNADFSSDFDDMDFGSDAEMGDTGFNTNNNAFDDSGISNDSTDMFSEFDNGVDQFTDADFSEEEQNENRALTKKTSIIIAIAGIIAFIIVAIIAIRFTIANSNKKNKSEASTQTVEDTQPRDVSDFVNTEDITNPDVNVTVQNVDDGQFKWTKLTGDDDIQFNGKEVDSEFTITAVNHYARAVNVNNDLNVKTVLNGNISGFTGTYTLEIPYSKGTKLHIGDSFKVKVQIGEYKGKTVVDGIKY